MRLPEGFVTDVEETFGLLKFSSKRRDVYEKDEEGQSTGVIKERTYDLKSKGAGQMIQVSIPEEAGEKEIPYDTEVELVDIMVDTVATPTYQGANVSWYVKAKDIVAKKRGNVPGKEENRKNGNQNTPQS